MPKNNFQRVVYTFIGALIMGIVMGIYNKYLVLGEFTSELFISVFSTLWQKLPVAFLLQFFLIQPWAAKQADKYLTDNAILYRIIRVGATVMLMCPLMSFWSQICNALTFHWTISKLFASYFAKMPVNWIFAFCVEVWLINPFQKFLFTLIFPNKEK